MHEAPRDARHPRCQSSEHVLGETGPEQDFAHPDEERQERVHPQTHQDAGDRRKQRNPGNTVDETIGVAFDDVVSLDRDVQVFLSVLGQSIPVEIPIRADVPVNLQTDVPIKLDVPVEVEIPIDLIVDVPVLTEVPIEVEIPVQMEFPVTIPLEQMAFGGLLDQVRDGLRALVEMLEGQAGGN